MLASIAWILVGMTLLAGLESWIPLQARRRARRDHLAPNLALTGLTFALNALFTAMLVMALARLEARDLGLLRAFALPVWGAVALAIAALDFATWCAHYAMHRIPAFWRFHQVHHSDPLVDVTTSIRQHPGETLIRAAFLAAFAAPLGVGPAAFALYRTASAANALLEHSNLRVPRRLDSLLSWVVVTPNAHKVHHSRTPRADRHQLREPDLALRPALRVLHAVRARPRRRLRPRRLRRAGAAPHGGAADSAVCPDRDDEPEPLACASCVGRATSIRCACAGRDARPPGLRHRARAGSLWPAPGR